MTQDITNYCQETLRLHESLQIAFIDLGQRLMIIRDERLYEQEYGDFDDFLIEMKMSSGTASKLINIYQIFVQKYKISLKRIAKAGGWSILAECLPMIRSREDAEDWLTKAELMTQTDFRRTYKEAKTGVSMTECKHDWIHLRICKCCGLRERDYESEQKKE